MAEKTGERTYSVSIDNYLVIYVCEFLVSIMWELAYIVETMACLSFDNFCRSSAKLFLFVERLEGVIDVRDQCIIVHNTYLLTHALHRNPCVAKSVFQEKKLHFGKSNNAFLRTSDFFLNVPVTNSSSDLILINDSLFYLLKQALQLCFRIEDVLISCLSRIDQK